MQLPLGRFVGLRSDADPNRDGGGVRQSSAVSLMHHRFITCLAGVVCFSDSDSRDGFLHYQRLNLVAPIRANEWIGSLGVTTPSLSANTAKRVER